MVDRGVADNLAHARVAAVLVCNQQRSGSAHKPRQKPLQAPRRHVACIGWLRDHASTALDDADNWRLISATTAFVRLVIGALVTLARLAADIGFVHLDDAM